MKLFVKTVFKNLFVKSTFKTLFTTTTFLNLHIGIDIQEGIFDNTFDTTFN